MGGSHGNIAGKERCVHPHGFESHINALRLIAGWIAFCNQQ